MRGKGEKPQVLFKRDIRKMENDIAHKMQILLFAFLMDELNYDEDRILEVNEALNKYLEAIDQKLITVKKVEEIIYEHTGMRIFKG